MAWTTIRGHRYYRRSVRIQGRVVTRHIGGGEHGEAVATLDAAKRAMREVEAELRRADRERDQLDDRAMADLDRVLADLFALPARRCGFYLHRRQWRRTRRADPMRLNQQLDALSGELDQLERRASPLMAPDYCKLPEVDQAILRAAARGDATAIAKAQPYLTDPQWIRVWGDPMLAARCWLVTQVSGDDVVVARTTHARAKMLREELGFEQANALEKIAITRIVHNWLSVAALDAKACQQPVNSRERTNVEKSLTQAERRLMQSIKTLAVVRGCSVAVLMATLSQSGDKALGEPT